MPKIKPHVGRGPMQAGFGGIVPPKLMPVLPVTTNNPISGDPYALLPVTSNVRLIGVRAQVSWTVQPSPLEVHVLVDGETWTWSKANPVTATPYALRDVDIAAAITGQSLNAVTTIDKAFVLEGRSMQLSTETTGGTVSQMYAEIIYATY